MSASLSNSSSCSSTFSKSRPRSSPALSEQNKYSGRTQSRFKMLRTVLRLSPRHVRRFCTRPAPPSDGPNHRSIMALDANTIRPFVQPNAFVAPSASVMGSVTVNDKTAIMYGAVVRGDLALIQIGAYVTIGENSVLTAGAVDGTMSPSDAISTGLPVEPELYVGDYSLVEAGVTLRGCRLAGVNVIGHCTSIGEGAVIGRFSIVLPGSVVEDGTEIPEKEVWGGNPARKVRDVTEDEQIKHMQDAERRVAVTTQHAYEFLPVGTVYLEKEALTREQREVTAK